MSTIGELIQETNQMAAKEALDQLKHSGEARIAAAHDANKRQQLLKDTVMPVVADEEDLPGYGKARPGRGKWGSPSLPNPGSFKWSEVPNQPGLIAIIGKVLALQAKTSSMYWSQMWKIASQNMKFEVQFAPIIGNAVKASWDAQSRATAAEADQAKQDGIINLCMFGASTLTAGVMEIKEWNDEPSTDAAKLTEDNPKAAANSALKANEEEVTEELNEAVNQEDPSFKQGASKDVGKVKSKYPSLIKRLTSVLGKAQSAAMMWGMLGQGITGFVNSTQLTKKEKAQGDAGKADALSKEAEQYAQYYGQAFSRSEDLRQGAQQAVDYAMNILKSSADNLTQAVVSMFRG